MRRAPALPTPYGVDACVALLSYEGAARELVARLKYRNARASLRWLAAAMAGLVTESVDIVTFVPTTPKRRRMRGFDQAELLADAVARELGAPFVALLRRGEGAPQTGRDAASRRAASVCIEPRRAVHGCVVLVDDVVTTGTTLSAAGMALRRGGASRVVAVVAARTPAPGDLH